MRPTVVHVGARGLVVDMGEDIVWRAPAGAAGAGVRLPRYTVWRPAPGGETLAVALTTDDRAAALAAAEPGAEDETC